MVGLRGRVEDVNTDRMACHCAIMTNRIKAMRSTMCMSGRGESARSQGALILHGPAGHDKQEFTNDRFL